VEDAMKETLTSLWSDFKGLSLGKACLLLLPFIIVIVSCVIVLILRPNDGKKFVKAVRHHEKYVGKRIKEGLKREEELADKEKELEKRHEAVKEEIRDNEKEAKATIDAIDAANGDPDELERIRRQLNARSRSRNRDS
jgi:hypothetical protein